MCGSMGAWICDFRLFELLCRVLCRVLCQSRSTALCRQFSKGLSIVKANVSTRGRRHAVPWRAWNTILSTSDRIDFPAILHPDGHNFNMAKTEPVCLAPFLV